MFYLYYEHELLIECDFSDQQNFAQKIKKLHSSKVW